MSPNYPEAAYFVNFTSTFLSLVWPQLETSNFINRLILVSSSLRMINHSQRGRGHWSVTWSFWILRRHHIFGTGEAMHFNVGKWIDLGECQPSHDKLCDKSHWPLFIFYKQVVIILKQYKIETWWWWETNRKYMLRSLLYRFIARAMNL